MKNFRLILTMHTLLYVSLLCTADKVAAEQNSTVNTNANITIQGKPFFSEKGIENSGISSIFEDL